MSSFKGNEVKKGGCSGADEDTDEMGRKARNFYGRNNAETTTV